MEEQYNVIVLAELRKGKAVVNLQIQVGNEKIPISIWFYINKNLYKQQVTEELLRDLILRPNTVRPAFGVLSLREDPIRIKSFSITLTEKEIRDIIDSHLKYETYTILKI